MYAILSSTLFPLVSYQNKFYPRDSAKDAQCKGRVRVQLKHSNNTAVNEKFPSSKQDVLIY